jgi:putative transposase
MPRKPRPISTEKPYHVYCRGNYKQPLFADEGAAEAFLETLGQVAEIHGWEVYAVAIMRNHFHLCVRTPRGDLSEGMHRLLTRFATRFNRLRKEQGHVFQGRFNAKLAPEGLSTRRIIDYIHLNPFRAGLCGIEELRFFPGTSLAAYMEPEARGWLAATQAMERFLGFPDTEDGRRAYLVALAQVAIDDPKGEVFRRDWADALREEAEAAKRQPRGVAGPVPPEVLVERAERQRQLETSWEAEAGAALVDVGLAEDALAELAKAHPLKLEVARRLKARGATCGWIAWRLKAGTGASLRVVLSRSKGSGR